MIGTVADGGIGPNTLAKLKEYAKRYTRLFRKMYYQDYQAIERQSYYEKLRNKS